MEMRYLWVYGFGNGNATAADEEYRLWFPHSTIQNKKLLIKTLNILCETGRIPSVHLTSEDTRRDVQYMK